jgi:FO synthase subunit 2
MDIESLMKKNLSRRDCLELFENEDDFFDIMKAADELRRDIVGDTVTYIINGNINYTNICTCGCRFCAFARAASSPDAYFMTPDQVAEKALRFRRAGATEICLMGGRNPKTDTYYQAELVRKIKTAAEPEGGILIHGFSPQDILTGAENAGLDVRSAIMILKEAGLSTMPGVAAEILVDDIRKELCPGKVSVSEWEDIIRTAHRCGVKTTSTIMYGHIESNEDRAEHLWRLRKIQEETGGFTEFILLPFLPENTEFIRTGRVKGAASGLTDMKMTAVSRLFFKDTIRNIQVPWVKLGVKFAQICLKCGGNDFSGSMMEDDISVAAGASYGTFMTRSMYEDAIRQIGRIPQERNTFYEPVTGKIRIARTTCGRHDLSE